jgi:hypothetical protein
MFRRQFASGSKSPAWQRKKNHTFIYPDKILRELKSKGGLIKSGKPKVAKRGWK